MQIFAIFKTFLYFIEFWQKFRNMNLQGAGAGAPEASEFIENLVQNSMQIKKILILLKKFYDFSNFKDILSNYRENFVKI